ncbi:MAG TPA: class F sortase [Dehalococcoidia bacterium]|nr:class F sortase [Dehalococcoidia bacterium]
MRSLRGFLLSVFALLALSFALGAALLLWQGGSSGAKPGSTASASASATSVAQPATNTSQPPAASPSPVDSSNPVPVALHAISRLVVPRVGIDAPIVTLGVDSDGVMQSPATPTDVGWYNFSSVPGGGGNIVLSGHVDYVNYGPAVFWNLRDLKSDDVVQVVLDDGSVVSYHVTAVTTYDDQNAPVQQIIGATPTETITMITCSGTFDTQSREYDKRLVVRATRA